MRKNKKLPSVTFLKELNIESEHINTVNRKKTFTTLIFLCFCQYFDEKVATSCPELSAILKILPLGTNHGGAFGWPLTLHNSANAQIRALYQPLAAMINLF